MNKTTQPQHRHKHTFTRLAWAVQLLWLLPLAGAAFVFARHPRDFYAALYCLVLLAWVAAMAAVYVRISRQPSRLPLLKWLTAQFTAILLLLTLIFANTFFYFREKKLQAWSELPDYGDMFPDIGLAVRKPDIGGMLADNMDAEVKSPWAGQTVHFHTNNYGFRRRQDTVIPKPEGTYRILFLGDSFVAGYRLDTDAVFGNVLERLLNEKLAAGEINIPAERIEVLNTNIECFHQAWWYLDNQAPQLEPDMVIYNTCMSNDFSQVLFGLGIPPDPPYGEWIWSDEGRPIPLPEELIQEAVDAAAKWFALPINLYPDYAFRKDAGPRPTKLTKERSPYAIARALQGFAQSWQYRHNYRGHDMSAYPGEMVYFCADTGVFLRKLPHGFDVAYRVVDKILGGFADWSRQHEVPLLVTAIPFRFQVIPQDYRVTFEQSAFNPEAFDMNQPNRFLAEEALKYKLPYFDFTPVFAEHGEETYKLFMPEGDVHWSEPGHKLAAESMLPWVVENIEKGGEAGK